MLSPKEGDRMSSLTTFSPCCTEGVARAIRPEKELLGEFMKVAHMKSFSGDGHVLSADSAPSAVRLVGVALLELGTLHFQQLLSTGFPHGSAFIGSAPDLISCLETRIAGRA